MTVLTATPPVQAASTAIIDELTAENTQAATNVENSLWRISVDKYHQMIDAGILTDDDPIELLEGLLVEKMSKKPPHRAVTLLLRRALERLIESGWYIDSQEPITTFDSEPEPDVTIVRGDTLDYLDRHPGPADIALVIEVADETLRRDRGIKKRLYARAGIPIYWVVNLNQLQIEVYSQPDQAAAVPDYRQQRIYQGDDQLPVILDGIEVGQILMNAVLPSQLAKQGEE